MEGGREARQEREGDGPARALTLSVCLPEAIGVATPWLEVGKRPSSWATATACVSRVWGYGVWVRVVGVMK